MNRYSFLLSVVVLIFSSSSIAVADIESGLIASYPFNGNANDESGNGNHGIVYGASLTTDRFGYSDSAYSFDGLDDFIDAGPSNIFDFGYSDFTIAVWVKYASLYDEQVVIEKFYATSGPGWTLTKLNNNIYSFGNGTKGLEVELETPPIEDEWYHVVIIRSNGALKFYWNGMEVPPLTGGSLPEFIGSSNTRLFIGKRNPQDGRHFFMNGAIDDIQIFLRALSANDVLELYQQQPVTNVAIDIKPGSDFNSVNLCSGGAVPIAILGSETFNVLNVDTETLRFAGASVKVVGKKDPRFLCSYEDVNGDLGNDLVCHFVTMDIAGIDGESISATLNGELFDGTLIEGTDSVNIVKDTC